VNLLKRGHLQTRSIDSFTDYPGLTEQLLAIQGLSTEYWSTPSIRQAMAVPAVFRAVTLIANLIGSLTMQAWRNGTLLTDRTQIPRLVIRPAVFGTTRDFWRDTGTCLAQTGEYIWKVVSRNDEGLADGLLLLPPHEVQVEWDENFPLVRQYRWKNQKQDADDIEHGFMFREPGGLRGLGPLQLCGAALSVAVEADEWAARFFSRGGVPSVVLKSAVNMSSDDADRLIERWVQRDSNEVRVASGGLTPEAFQVNPEQAQLLDSRKHSAADIATAFGMDADLLNAAVSGSSLTYQNVGQRFDNFIRSTLAPNYLEPIEQGISERLTRTTVGRFSLQSLTRADVQTQANVFKTLVDGGLPQPQALGVAGLDSLVDTEPVPAPEKVNVVVPSF
jgi:HK97 family phage portal protein